MSTVLIGLLVLLGALAGCLSGLLGIGGGVILVPSLVFLFGLSEHLAQGTTLAIMVPPIGILAAHAYYKKGHVNLRIAGLACIGFAVGGFLGAKLAIVLSNVLLERVFGGGMLLLAFKMLSTRDDTTEVDGRKPGKPLPQVTGPGSALLFILLGLLTGTMSGLLGIGGGVIMVPALVFCCGFSQAQAQGTTLALMVPPVGLLAAWEYFQQGDVNLGIAGLICAGFVIGAFWGAKLANRLSNQTLSRVFGVSMLLIAIKMLLAA